MATSTNESPGHQDDSDSSEDQRDTSSDSLAGTSRLQALLRTFAPRDADSTVETTDPKKVCPILKGIVQLGITHTVGCMNSKADRDVLLQDFDVIESYVFPSVGSHTTPAHNFGDFKFRVYAPVAFRYFREMFGIHPDDYLFSLCSDTLIELENPGASGSLFYRSSDDEYIIKTVQNHEAEFLQKLLPGYFMNLNQNKRTLLPKFYGLYCLNFRGKDIRLVVMNNLIPSSLQMEVIYDLKGSTHMRRASKKEKEKAVPTLKDLDFMEQIPGGLLLHTDKYNALCKTLQRDCLLLQSFKIMDYSLLVAVHNIDQTLRDLGDDFAEADNDRKKKIPAHKSLYSTAIEAIQGDVESELSFDKNESTGGIPARNSGGDRLLIYLGIIDILQSYRLSKKLEHSLKSLMHDSDSISVHRPSFYADRFLNFMCTTVFKRITSHAKTCSCKSLKCNDSTENLTCAGPSAPSNVKHEEQKKDTKKDTSSKTVKKSSHPDVVLRSNAEASTSQISPPKKTYTEATENKNPLPKK